MASRRVLGMARQAAAIRGAAGRAGAWRAGAAASAAARAVSCATPAAMQATEAATAGSKASAAAAWALVSAVVALGGGWASVACANIFEVSDADEMQEHPEKYSRQEVCDLLAKMHEAEPEDTAVMWRYARAKYELAGETSDKAEGKKLMGEALALVRKARDKNASSSDIHRWCGTILSGYSDYLSTKESIANSYRIREHWDDAVAVNPHDASAKHLLGRWSFTIASLSWLKRNIAKALFGAPPVSSFAEALQFFEDAEREQPGFWKYNQVMIAECHYQLGNKEEAKEWASKAAKLPTVTADDKEAEAKVQALLKKL